MSDEIDKDILEKYEILEKIGQGAASIVWKATDKKEKRIVAIKKIIGAFHDVNFAKKTFYEVILLRQEFRSHNNIIGLIDMHKTKDHKDLYLVYEFMEANLHKIIQSNKLEESHKQYIIYQLLKTLKYIHSAGLIHRNITPQNILINSDYKIKLSNFGFICSVNSPDKQTNIRLADLLSNRFYSAPEILLGSTAHSQAVDTWSVGCILGELILEKGLFKTTSSLIEQVFELIGKPNLKDMESIDSPNATAFLNLCNFEKKKNFESFFTGASEAALDFLRKLLVFNPNKRLTVEEALKHKYLEAFSSSEEEDTVSRPIKLPMEDNTKLSIQDYRVATYLEFHTCTGCRHREWRHWRGNQKQYLVRLCVESEMLKQQRRTSSPNENKADNQELKEKRKVPNKKTSKPLELQEASKCQATVSPYAVENKIVIPNSGKGKKVNILKKK